MTDIELYRLLQGIQQQLAEMHHDRELTLVTLTRLNNNLEVLTDEMKNINHLLTMVNRRLTRMHKDTLHGDRRNSVSDVVRD